MDDASKDDRFLYRFDPSNMNGVKSTKNSDGRQLQLRTLCKVYGEFRWSRQIYSQQKVQNESSSLRFDRKSREHQSD